MLKQRKATAGTGAGKEIQLTARRIQLPESLRKRAKKALPDVPPVLGVEKEELSPEAMTKEEIAREVSAPRRSFLEAVAAECATQGNPSQPKLTAGEDERMWDKAFERVLLPPKVKRLEEQIKTMNLKRTPTLTAREEKIYRVIQAGSKGAQYCREVHNAGVKPHRAWLEDDCPGTYPAAYLDSNKWRQRINDEKSKIRRKAELAGLAGE